MGLLDPPGVPRSALAPVATTARLRAPVPPMAARVKRMIGAFASGHGWTKSGTATTFNLNDTTDHLLGTQAITFTTGGTGVANSVLFSKAGLALDLTGRAVRVYIKISDLSSLGYVRLYLGDSTLANNYNKQILNTSTAPAAIAVNGEWATLDIIVDTMNVVGTPTRASIDTVRLMVGDTGTATVSGSFGGVASVAMDELNRWPGGVVALTFDDSYDSTYSIARPILDAYGYIGSLFPIVSKLDTTGAMTTAQALGLRDQGWEVAAHATTTAVHNVGIAAMTQANRLAELEMLRQWNADHACPSTSYAYPLGYWSRAAAQDVGRYYTSARLVAEDGLGNPRLEDAYRVRSANAGTYATQLSGLADKALAARAALVVTVHDVVASGATGNNITTANFQAFIDHCASIGIPVVPYGELVAASLA